MRANRSLLVRNALLVTPSALFDADLLAIDGRWAVVQAAGTLPLTADEEHRAEGLLALPGLIDAHAHFREPGEHAHKATYASESRSAAAGGVTTVLTMPNTKPFTDNLGVLAQVQQCATNCVVDYGFHFMARADNLEQLTAALAEPGVVGGKLYLNPTTGIDASQADTDQVRSLLTSGIRLTAHAEGETLLWLLEAHRRWGAGHLHLAHVALAGEVEAIRKARSAGQWVTAEVTPHHLLLDEDDAVRLGPLGDMRPTLKSRADLEACWSGLSDGTIDLIASDHAPHLLSEKLGPTPPPGVCGVQSMLPLLLDQALTGVMPLSAIARWTAAAPAGLFGLRSKGAVRVGGDADLVLCDPKATHTITNDGELSLPGWTPFAGRRLQGAVVRTLRRGEWIYADGEVLAQGGGRPVEAH